MKFLSIILIFSSYKPLLSELYTAIEDIKSILHTEGFLAKTLQKYIEVEHTRLDTLQKIVELYKKQYELASEDVDTFVANPLNAYLLIKRLTVDWNVVESLLQAKGVQEIVKYIIRSKGCLIFPTDEDLNGAATAIIRLQDTYNLETSSLASGELNGIKYNFELDAEDCFEIGLQSYNSNDFYYAYLWMIEANTRLGRGLNEISTKSNILEYLAFSAFKLGNVSFAMNLTNEILEVNPEHPRAMISKSFYEEALSKFPNVSIATDDLLSPKLSDHSKRNIYEQLCREEITTSNEITSQLKCYYLVNKNPFLLIGPFKVEEAYRDPYILLFHEVMYDGEIKTLKKMALPRFERGSVGYPVPGKQETTPYRICKVAWLKKIEHIHVANIRHRVAAMTGLSLETAENLQVANYGIGGYYESHFDLLERTTHVFDSLGGGKRLATVLFYMSDVSKGATVFPNINVILRPKKGTAAFWYNLHPSGEGDVRTMHAACPVLVGSKWVSTTWFHEGGQEFRRPCGLQPAPPEQTI